MTNDDLISRIEAALGAGPTPGPWFVSSLLGFAVASIAKTRIASDQAPIDMVEIDAEYIAACNPVAIRTLLDRLKAAEAENEQLRDELRTALENTDDK